MTAKSLRHKFQSGIADGADATLVRPSNWNDDHNFYLGQRNVSGTTDTIADGDNQTLVSYTNAGATTITLPAPASGNMALGWSVFIEIASATGSASFTFTGSATINGASSFPLRARDQLELISDGSTDYTGIYTPGSPVQSNVTATFGVGYTFTAYNAGTVSSGTLTPAPANGNYQYYTNNGAHTLAVPASDCAIDILVTNGATAGAITFSGSYTVASGNTGDPLTTTNGNRFIISIRRINAISTYAIKALQ